MVSERADLFVLRVLVEFDETYSIWVARCLETGGVTTADEEPTVRDMMKELLEDEILHALQEEDFGDLFSCPADPDVWFRWTEFATSKAPTILKLFDQPERKKIGTETQTATGSVKLATAA